MPWYNIFHFGLAFCAGEILSLLIFYFIRKKYEKRNIAAGGSVLKGMLERFALLLGLTAGVPTIIIFFGAIKLGTRLKEQQESPISNDYFLVGNITSIIIVLLQFQTYLLLNEHYSC